MRFEPHKHLLAAFEGTTKSSGRPSCISSGVSRLILETASYKLTHGYLPQSSHEHERGVNKHICTVHITRSSFKPYARTAPPKQRIECLRVVWRSEVETCLACLLLLRLALAFQNLTRAHSTTTALRFAADVLLLGEWGHLCLLCVPTEPIFSHVVGGQSTRSTLVAQPQEAVADAMPFSSDCGVI